MTPALRKAHRTIWFTLAGLLPLGWLAAIWVIPEAVWQAPIRVAQPGQLPALVCSKQSGDFIVSLRQDRNGTRHQIEFQISKPLTEPNTSVILEGDPEILLGTLGTRGIRRFELDSLSARRQPLKVRLEDKIELQVLRTITLKE